MEEFHLHFIYLFWPHLVACRTRSSLTMDWTCAPAMAVWILNHWTTRKSLTFILDLNGIKLSILGWQMSPNQFHFLSEELIFTDDFCNSPRLLLFALNFHLNILFKTLKFNKIVAALFLQSRMWFLTKMPEQSNGEVFLINDVGTTGKKEPETLPQPHLKFIRDIKICSWLSDKQRLLKWATESNNHKKKKLINWTSSKFKTSTLQKSLLRKWTDEPQTWVKRFANKYLAKDWFAAHAKNSTIQQ